ncbi:MAG: lipopolysaccharide biosynthesis protein [Prevotella sp.]|jgi:O-antigen/teichoic acid export membrane protein|nr:lipopolysaccharide biosynthesis protein [Prevotella sp.]
MSDRQKKLVQDIFIYGIGTIGSKMFGLLIFPLYTHFLPREDVGYYDITLTVIFLLLPLYTFQLREGIFRYIIHASKSEKPAVYKIVFNRIGKNTLWVLLLAVVLHFIHPVAYLEYLVALILLNGIYEVQGFALRIENKKDYVLANMLSVMLTLAFSYLFLAQLDMGLQGVYAANILARLIPAVIMEYKYRFTLSMFDKSVTVNKKFENEIFRYSMMLIPVGVYWFLLDLTCKLFIQHQLGLEQNGIYAIANKFMMIPLTLSFIFYQAWQETAVIEYNSPNRNSFFSSIFNAYLLILSILSVIACIFLKISYPYFIHYAYTGSLKYIYPLFICVIFNALANFLDMGYQCSKQTYWSIPSIVFAIVVNILLNYLLIKPFGTMGVAIAYALTMMLTFIFRFYDTKRFFTLKWNAAGYSSVIVLCLGGVVFYQINNIYLLVASGLLFSGIFLTFIIKSGMFNIKKWI